jgi:uncharacterized protein
MAKKPETEAPETALAWRQDRGELLEPVFREDGTALLEGVFARPGIYEYRQPDGSVVRELVPLETIHDPAYLETVARSVLTLEHPKVDAKNAVHVVNPDNYAEHSVGDVDGDVEIVKDTGFVRIKMAARRRDALDAIRRGVRELSPGYQCRLEMTPGTDPVFGRFDAIQRDRRNNHVAIVERARGGRDCAFRVDAAVQIDTREHKEDATMDELLKMLLALQLDGSTVKLDADTRLDAKMVRQIMEDMQGEIKKLKRDLEKKSGECDGYKAQVDELNSAKEKAAEEKPTPDQEKADRLDWFKTRSALLEIAKVRKVDGYEDLDNSEIRRAIVKSVKPDLREDASDEYISAAYDVITSVAKTDGEDKWDALRVDAKPETKPEDREDGTSGGWAGMVKNRFPTNPPQAK